jgi:hypothetical protein
MGAIWLQDNATGEVIERPDQEIGGSVNQSSTWRS